MALVSLTKGYRVSSDDIVAMISVSDLNYRASDEERARIHEDIQTVISSAKERGMYYQFTRGQEIIRSVLILRNGMVFGTSITGETINASMGLNKKTRTSRKKATSNP